MEYIAYMMKMKGYEVPEILMPNGSPPSDRDLRQEQNLHLIIKLIESVASPIDEIMLSRSSTSNDWRCSFSDRATHIRRVGCAAETPHKAALRALESALGLRI